MASGLADFLGTGNPFQQWVSGNRGRLGAFGAGLASGTDFATGLSNAAQNLPRGAAVDDAYAQMQEEKAQQTDTLNQTTEWLRNNGHANLLAAVESGAMTPGQAWEIALQPAPEGPRPIEINGQLVDPMTGAVIGDYRDQMGENGSGVEYGLTPIWGRFDDGTFGYGVQGKDGSFKQVDTGNLSPLDPRTLSAERGFGTQIGNAQGSQAASAQGDISNATTALDLINQIKTSPELPYATGFSAGIGGNKVWGTGRYGFQNLVDQAKSGAFLTAIQDMKGLGALSNTEGQVATAAITRMDTALNKEDFLKALADYESIIARALDRAQGRVGMQPNANTPTGSPAQGQNYVFNPATGQLEPQ